MSDALEAIFDAERSLRQAEQTLLADTDVRTVLQTAVSEALALDESDEATLRLERLADLCAQVTGPEMADAMIAILNSSIASVRVAVGEALLDVAYDYYAEVARAIDRALDDGTKVRALEELPFMLAEIGEPGAGKQLRRFLAHGEAKVVASAIEAATELGLTELKDALFELTDDERDVTLEDLDESMTLGELAQQALVELER